MKETLTLLERCQREAREKYAQDMSPKAHNLLSAEDLDTLIANTLKQAAEALEGMKQMVQSEEPFVPHYKPDGMSEEEYVYHIHSYEQERAEWLASNEYNQALTDAQRLLLGEDND